jgi:tetraacyldisaccharide-1-P 4'-kinase
MWFRDHHRYDRRDIDQIVAAAVAAGAHAVLTTEKDASRLDVSSITSLPFAAIPLAVTVEPAPAFGDWLETRLRTGPRPGATTA